MHSQMVQTQCAKPRAKMCAKPRTIILCIDLQLFFCGRVCGEPEARARAKGRFRQIYCRLTDCTGSIDESPKFPTISSPTLLDLPWPILGRREASLSCSPGLTWLLQSSSLGISYPIPGCSAVFSWATLLCARLLPAREYHSPPCSLLTCFNEKNIA